MKKIALSLAACLVATLTLFATDSPDGTKVITIQYVKVIDAFRILNEALPEGAAAVVALDARSNTLVLDSTDPNYKKAREILGPDVWLCPEVKVVLETDPTRARAAARSEGAGLWGSCDGPDQPLE